MALTDINSEDRLVQQTFAEHLERVLGWESVYAYQAETFGPQGMLSRAAYSPLPPSPSPCGDRSGPRPPPLSAHNARIFHQCP